MFLKTPWPSPRIASHCDSTDRHHPQEPQCCSEFHCAPSTRDQSVPILTPDGIAKFWSSAKPDGDCLIWSLGKTSRGYGSYRIRQKFIQAHRLSRRLSYILTHGSIPDGMVIRHSCDRPACIAPAHLVVGTQQDNLRDMRERGRDRHVRGSENHNSKLTEEDVVLIRTLRASGVSLTDLAARFGMQKGHICGICVGNDWRHVGGPITRERKRKST